jgi:hypothetical protein
VSGDGGRERERRILFYIDPVSSQVTWTGGTRSAKLAVLWDSKVFLPLFIFPCCLFVFSFFSPYSPTLCFYSMPFPLPTFVLYVSLYLVYLTLFSAAYVTSSNTMKILNVEGKSLWMESSRKVLSQYFPASCSMCLSHELNWTFMIPICMQLY